MADQTIVGNGGATVSRKDKTIVRRKICMVALVFVLVLVVAGCATNIPLTPIPITQGIINEVGGVDAAAKFQYYISKPITLRLVAQNRVSSIEDGHLVRQSQTVRAQIFIPRNLPGVMRSHQPRVPNDNRRGGEDQGGYILGVAFENYRGDPVILFGQHARGYDQKYFILYEDTANKIIKYGNDRYMVSYEGDEPPYLLIAMKQTERETSTSRRAGGIKLGR